jgi:uncharacterized repeat protein (TIGR02543 family)
MTNHTHLLAFLVLGLFVAVVSGCSGGGGGGSDVTVLPSQSTLNAESQACAQCHPAAGASYALSLHNTENAATCARCHSPAPGHPNPPTAVANPDAAGVCLQCHVNQGLPHFNPAIVNTEGAFDGNASAQYVDASLTSPNNDLLFPGITGSQLGCKACHNPHDTTSRMSIFKQYSEGSGHGDVNGAAWVHYRWKGADRAACQRCHTTSAFISHITGGPSSLTFNNKDNTKQTLYCIGCHVNNTYAVRPAPQEVASYSNNGTFNSPSDPNPVIDPVTGVQTGVNTFPDVGKSNLCLNCHAARAIGDSITQAGVAPNPAADFSNLSFINSHYLTGGATVYAVSGYEYPGRTYVNRSSYAHNKIGTSLEPTTGSGGPCVGCHMTTANHTFKGWTKDEATDKITSVTTFVCASCHSDMTPDTMNEEKELFEAALAALNAQLAVKGFYFSANNPYFFTAPYVTGGTNTGTKNWLSPGDTDKSGDTTGRKNMGAAFNLNLLAHDPGAYTHNRYYVKRLIYDSIDWMDNNVLDNSSVAAIDALLAAGRITQSQHDLAITYILRQGARP